MTTTQDPAVGVPASRRGKAPADTNGVDGPPLPPPPERTEAQSRVTAAADSSFRVLNRTTTGPLLRAGFGPWMGTPMGGYLLLMRVRGRKTGLVRDVPLSYYVDEGAIWVMAGFGPRTQWYRNLLANPDVEVVLPGRTRRCVAEEVLDPETRRRILPKLLRATGAPGFMSGCDPWHATVDEIVEVTSWVPLIRLRPLGEPLAAGPDDPGGLAWIWRQAVIIGVTLLVARIAVGLVRRAFGALRLTGGR